MFKNYDINTLKGNYEQTFQQGSLIAMHKHTLLVI